GYVYDNHGNLLTRTDARGIVTTMSYDSLDRVLTKAFSDGPSGTPSVSFTYGLVGQPCAPNMHSVAKLCSETNSASTTSYKYEEPLGRISGSTQTTSGFSYPFSYEYKLNNSLEKVTYPSGRVVEYGYYASGRASRVAKGLLTDPSSYSTALSYAPN